MHTYSAQGIGHAAIIKRRIGRDGVVWSGGLVMGDGARLAAPLK